MHHIEFFIMNKDLPEPIKKIFKDPDPLIWQGIWLEILNLLLSHKQMIMIWTEFVEIIKDKYNEQKNMPFDQFLKWESKAFVAKAIKLKNTVNSRENFIDGMHQYFSKKDIFISREMIDVVYKVLNKN